MKAKFIALSALSAILLGIQAHAQVPTDNPYAARYNAQDHWTSQLKWNQVTEATGVAGLIDARGRVDSLVMQKTLRAIAGTGGGVLYFSAGMYFFDYQLNLVSNVIIRGASPTGTGDAAAAGYNPPTKFEFPKYKPVFAGAGTPHAAVKSIYADTTGLERFGLVNLSINRANIAFYAGGYAAAGGQGIRRPALAHTDVILLGIRQNNAVVLHPGVPTKIMEDEGQGWQRWPWPYGANIDVFVGKNCVIANCRLNDNVTDNYEQDNYLDNQGHYYTGPQAMFNFADHPGINVNVSKIHLRDARHEVKDAWSGGKWSPHVIFANHATSVPLVNPASAPGIEIMDNYVVTTPRYYGIRNQWPGADATTRLLDFSAINAVGDALRISGNKIDSVGGTSMVGKNGDFTTTPDRFEAKFFEKDVFTGSAKKKLPYQLMQPEHYEPNKKYPLVLFLHGHGEKGNDNEIHMKHFVWTFSTREHREQFPCFVLAPQHPGDIGWNNSLMPAASWPLAASVELIRTLASKYAIDMDRIYVIGFSSGGRGSMEAILRYPRFFAGAVPIGSSIGISEKEAKAMKRVPVWLFQGQLDRFSPVGYTRLLVKRLRDAGGKPRYTEYPNRGIMLATTVAREQELFPWLFAQKK